MLFLGAVECGAITPALCLQLKDFRGGRPLPITGKHQDLKLTVLKRAKE